MRLIELSIKAARARDWWLRQRRRRTGYFVWCGPRQWLRHVYGPPPLEAGIVMRTLVPLLAGLAGGALSKYVKEEGAKYQLSV